MSPQGAHSVKCYDIPRTVLVFITNRLSGYRCVTTTPFLDPMVTPPSYNNPLRVLVHVLHPCCKLTHCTLVISLAPSVFN